MRSDVDVEWSGASEAAAKQEETRPRQSWPKESKWRCKRQRSRHKSYMPIVQLFPVQALKQIFQFAEKRMFSLSLRLSAPSRLFFFSYFSSIHADCTLLCNIPTVWAEYGLTIYHTLELQTRCRLSWASAIESRSFPLLHDFVFLFFGEIEGMQHTMWSLAKRLHRDIGMM